VTTDNDDDNSVVASASTKLASLPSSDNNIASQFINDNSDPINFASESWLFSGDFDYDQFTINPSLLSDFANSGTFADSVAPQSDPLSDLIDNYLPSIDYSTTTQRPQQQQPQPMLMLANGKLWRLLSTGHHINEMIITPTGRRIFPYIELQAFNLDPFRSYRLAMDLIDLDPERLYRYDKSQSRWMARTATHGTVTCAGSINSVSGGVQFPYAEPDRHWHWHPGGVQTGADWMRTAIEFQDVRVMSHLQDPRRPAAMHTATVKQLRWLNNPTGKHNKQHQLQSNKFQGACHPL
jgi:hypothetical protein